MIERIDGDANELGGFFSIFVVESSGQRVAARLGYWLSCSARTGERGWP